MRIKAEAVAFIVTLTVGSSALLFAARYRPAMADEPAPVRSRSIPALYEMQGQVTEVDASNGNFTMLADEGPLNFSVEPATTIFVRGRTALLVELRVGDVVTAAYEETPRGPRAHWIELVE